MISVTALMCVRNEAHGLEVVLQHIAAAGMRLAVIDNDSTDATPALLDRHASLIVHRRRMPFTGAFDLAAMLAEIEAMAATIDSDWLVLNSGDEILQSPVPGESLRAGLDRAHRAGRTVVNFNEYVFPPVRAEEDYAFRDYYAGMTHYYHFAPHPLRLMRAWRNGQGFRLADAGHRLGGGKMNLHPETFALRHYPHLSLAHLRAKYPTRRFAPEALAKGWHHNRIHIDPQAVALPRAERLKCLADPDSRAFDTSDPWTRHHWEDARRPLQ